jgi:O-methyltransferase
MFSHFEPLQRLSLAEQFVALHADLPCHPCGEGETAFGCKGGAERLPDPLPCLARYDAPIIAEAARAVLSPNVREVWRVGSSGGIYRQPHAALEIRIPGWVEPPDSSPIAEELLREIDRLEYDTHDETGASTGETPLPNPILLYDEDDVFMEIMSRVEPHSLVQRAACFMLYQLATKALAMPGDAAELGVYRGGTARLIGEVFSTSTKVVYLFDTFAGLPGVEPGLDLHREGEFGDVSYKEVRRYLSDLPNIRFRRGLFPESAKSVDDHQFCFVHVDADVYGSVLDACRFFFERLVPGGVVVFDDFGQRHCPGARAAVTEFAEARGVPILYLPTGQALLFAAP